MAKRYEEEKAPAKTRPVDSKRPEAAFRIGLVSASVIARDIEAEREKWTFRSVAVQRRYQDGNESKHTSSFNLSELVQAIRVLQLAQYYVEQRDAHVPLGD